MNSTLSKTLAAVLALATFAVDPLAAIAAPIPEKPNVIVIVTDDHGYADVGFHDYPASGEALTPNLDRLAESGIIFRHGYVASSTCGPSRASLLTGRSSSRFGMEANDNMDDGDTGPPLSEILLPAALKGTGYASAAFGKWHLGEKKKERMPLARGFDYYWGDIPAQKDYLMARLEDPPSWKSGEESPREYGRYVTDAYTDEAVSFIRRSKEQPFFIYLAYNAPHSPFRSYDALMKRIVEHAPQYEAAYERMKKHTERKKGEPYFDGTSFDFGTFKGENLDQELMRLTYLSMLLAADDGVGKLIATLDELDLRKKTLVYFLSDNGAALTRPNDLGGVNLPLRDGKGSVYDGGVRVPFVMSWPGVLPEGVLDTERVVSSMDIFTTTVKLADAKLPDDRVIDGVNLMPYLTGRKESNPHDELFFRRQEKKEWAILQDGFKLDNVPARPAYLRREGVKPEHYPKGGGLYHVEDDLSEVNDLSDEMPEKKSELTRLYKRLSRDLPDIEPTGGSDDDD